LPFSCFVIEYEPIDKTADAKLVAMTARITPKESTE
jgi:hypothetical protein